MVVRHPLRRRGHRRVAHTIHNFMDSARTMSGTGGIPIISTTFFDDASKWNFAWALYAGLAYQVTPAFTVEFAYRYVNLGNADDGSAARLRRHGHPTSPFVFDTLTSNDSCSGCAGEESASRITRRR